MRLSVLGWLEFGDFDMILITVLVIVLSVHRTVGL